MALFERVRDALKKDQAEDDMLVDRGVHAAAQTVRAVSQLVFNRNIRGRCNPRRIPSQRALFPFD